MSNKLQPRRVEEHRFDAAYNISVIFKASPDPESANVMDLHDACCRFTITKLLEEISTINPRFINHYRHHDDHGSFDCLEPECGCALTIVTIDSVYQQSQPVTHIAMVYREKVKAPK